MAYLVKFEPTAQRQIKRLGHDVRDRVVAKALALANNPRPHGCKKLVGLDEWRISVGDYRIIYEIHDRVLIVKVVRVSHRSNAYRDR